MARKEGNSFFGWVFFHFSVQNIYRGSTLNYKELHKGQELKNTELPTPSCMTNQIAFTSDQPECFSGHIKFPFCC